MKTISVTSCAGLFRAKCHCGWASEPTTQRADADFDARLHYESCPASQRVPR